MVTDSSIALKSMLRARPSYLLLVGTQLPMVLVKNRGLLPWRRRYVLRKYTYALKSELGASWEIFFKAPFIFPHQRGVLPD